VSAELAAPVLSDAQPRLSERKRAVPAVGALHAPSSSALAAEPRRPSVALPAGRRCRSIAPGRSRRSDLHGALRCVCVYTENREWNVQGGGGAKSYGRSIGWHQHHNPYLSLC
jgi:hypothetical protein